MLLVFLFSSCMCLSYYFCFCVRFAVFLFFFFFSSRRRHTRLVSDWSSYVCSSDLRVFHLSRRTFTSPRPRALRYPPGHLRPTEQSSGELSLALRRKSELFSHTSAAGRHGRNSYDRSEERRVGKGCGCGGWVVTWIR